MLEKYGLNTRKAGPGPWQPSTAHVDKAPKANTTPCWDFRKCICLLRNLPQGQRVQAGRVQTRVRPIIKGPCAGSQEGSLKHDWEGHNSSDFAQWSTFGMGAMAPQCALSSLWEPSSSQEPQPRLPAPRGEQPSWQGPHPALQAHFHLGKRTPGSQLMTPSEGPKPQSLLFSQCEPWMRSP